MTMSTEPTPAVQRAEEAFKAKINVAVSTLGWSVTLSDGAMRTALAAALDIEEMARVLCRRIHRSSLWPLESIPSSRRACTSCMEHSDTLRASILGSDQ